MRDNKRRGDSKSNYRESKGAGTPTTRMAYDYRAASNELFPTSVQANTRLPTGRPFLNKVRVTDPVDYTVPNGLQSWEGTNSTASTGKITFSDSRNNDAPFVQRVRLYFALPDVFGDSDHVLDQWLSYAVQQMYTGLRLENRSNVGYSVADLKAYLVQVVTLYAYARAATTHMMCYNMSDPRAPALQAALCGGLDDGLTIGDALTYQWVIQADDTSHLPVWMRNIQESWSAAKLAADQLATLPIPARVKQYLDYLLGTVFIDEKRGGQYYKIDITTSFDQFTWTSINKEGSQIEIGSYFAEPTTKDRLWKAIAQIATALSGPTATLNTMVSDLRRLEGMVPCVIDIPSNFGELPNLVANDDLFFDTIDNACYLPLEGLMLRTVPEVSFKPTIPMGEVRVDASADLDNPSRLAMITSLMAVANGADGGALGAFMTPWVYGGTCYVRQNYMQYGSSEVLTAYVEAFPSTLTISAIRGDIIVMRPGVSNDTHWANGDNLSGITSQYTKRYKNSVFYDPNVDPMRLVRFATMEHHPAMVTIRQRLVVNASTSTSKPEAVLAPSALTGDAGEFELIKNLKEGTRVSIDALRDVQYYAWASLFRL